MARYSTRVGFSVHDGVREIAIVVSSDDRAATAVGRNIELLCTSIETQLRARRTSKKTIDRIVDEAAKKAVRLGESVEYELFMEAAFADSMKESGWEQKDSVWSKKSGQIIAEIRWKRTWGDELICDAEIIIEGHGRLEVASCKSLRAAAEQLVAQMRAIGAAIEDFEAEVESKLREIGT